MNGGAPARLFVGLWPDAAARAALVEWQSRWQWPPRAAPIPAERLHLTLHFLGSVPRARVAEIAAGLACAVPRFEIAFGRAAVWPQGLALALPLETPPPLAALHRHLAQALDALGLPIDERPFAPHVTLARQARGAVAPAAPLACRWRVEGCALVESERGYRTLARYPAS